MTEQEYLATRVEDQIAWLGGKSGWNQLRFKRMRLAEISLASLVPVIAAAPIEAAAARILCAGAGA